MTRHLMFDFDGTLFDTAHDYGLCFQELARVWDEPRPIPDVEVIRRLMFAGVQPQVEYALGALSSERYLEALELFRVVCQRIPLTHTAPYPGILAVVTELHARGYTTSICTNRPQDLAERDLDLMGLRDHFGPIRGGDAGLERKPEPEMLLALAEDTGIEITESVLIGDSDVDLYAAQRAGCGAALVSWGYTPRAQLAALNPPHLIDDADALLKLFPRL